MAKNDDIALTSSAAASSANTDLNFEVIFNRRQDERRQREVPVQVERRRGDRRVRDVSYELRRLGYALVRREAPR